MGMRRISALVVLEQKNMNKKFSTMVVMTVGLAAALWLLAQSRGGTADSNSAGCCGAPVLAGASGESPGASAAPLAAVASVNTGATPALMQPVQSVFENYIKLQTALAQDSTQDVQKTAAAMAKAIREDSMKMLSPEVAQQAEALANAKDIEAAREAFKPLSQSLIEYLKAQKVPSGTYHEVYCPMAMASWLQTGKTVANPYFGQAMLRCGQFKN